MPAKTRAERSLVREKVGGERFVEVFVNTNPALSAERKPDADLEGFEEPAQPDVTVSMDESKVEKAVDKIIELLAKRHQVDLG